MTVEEANQEAESINRLLAAGNIEQAIARATSLRDCLRENVTACPELLPNLDKAEQALTQLQLADKNVGNEQASYFASVAIPCMLLVCAACVVGVMEGVVTSEMLAGLARIVVVVAICVAVMKFIKWWSSTSTADIEKQSVYAAKSQQRARLRSLHNCVESYNSHMATARSEESQAHDSYGIAASSLERAEEMFSRRAYGLMYGLMFEAMVVATNSLNHYAASLARLEQAATLVLQSAEQLAPYDADDLRDVDFTPVNISAVIDPDSLTRKLHEVTMLGETTPECTMIWEQKRTQGILIVGFGSLAEAVNGIQATLRGGFVSTIATLKTMNVALGHVSDGLYEVASAASRVASSLDSEAK